MDITDNYSDGRLFSAKEALASTIKEDMRGLTRSSHVDIRICLHRLWTSLALSAVISATFASPILQDDPAKKDYWAKVNALGKPFANLQQLVKDLEKYHNAKDSKKYFSLLAASYDDNSKRTIAYADKLAAIPPPSVYVPMMQKYIAVLRASGLGMKKLVPLARAQKMKELNTAWAKFSKIRTDNVQVLQEVTEEHKLYSK